jgi:cytochrome d ubiquinol oxidase subunit I
VATSLTAFLIIYAIVFSVGVLYILRLIAEGPSPGEQAPEPENPGVPLSSTEIEPEGSAS